MIRRNRDASIALALAIIFFTGVALIRDDTARLRSYLEVVAALVFFTALADRAAHFSRAMVGALSSVMIIHLVGGLMTPIGDVPTFYESWLIPGVLKFDQLAHAYGSGVLTFAMAQLVIGLLGPPKAHRWGLAFVAALMACGLGALNELVEFFFGLNNPNLHAGGLDNAGWDLLFNLVGVTIAATWLIALGVHRDEVDHEYERFVGTDHATGALAAVRQVRRDR